MSLHAKTWASQWWLPKKLSAANVALFFEDKLNLVLVELLFVIWGEFNATQRNFLLLIINFHPLLAKAKMLKKNPLVSIGNQSKREELDDDKSNNLIIEASIAAI